MGVVGSLALLVTGVMLAAELYVVTQIRPEKFNPTDYNWKITRLIMRQVYKLGPWVERTTFNSLIFSFILSVLVGMMYPVAGIIGLVGGIGSTVAIQPYYMWQRKMKAFRTSSSRSARVYRKLKGI